MEEREINYHQIDPHFIENETQGNIAAAILKGGAAFIATQAALSKTSTFAKKPTAANVIAIGAAFAINMLNGPGGFKEAAIASGAIASGVFYGPMFMKRDDSFYERVGKFNQLVGKGNGFLRRIAEARLESSQRFFTESKTKDFFEQIKDSKDMFVNGFKYAFKIAELEKSKAHEFINNEKGFHSKFLKESNVMDATMFRELEASLPSDIVDYARKYFKLNQKIDQTSYDSTKLLAGVSYFTDTSKKVDDWAGTVDMLKVFGNNLNKEVNVYFEEAAEKMERYSEYHQVKGVKGSKPLPYYFGHKQMFIDANIPEDIRHIKDKEKRYEAVVEHFKKDKSDPILTALAERQAKPNEVTLGEFMDRYNNVLKEKSAEIKAIFSYHKAELDKVDYSKGNVEKAVKLTMKEKGFEEAYKSINIIKESLSPFMFTPRFRKPTSEVVDDIMTSGVFTNKPMSNPEMLFTFKGQDDVYGKMIMNTRLHKFIEKNSKGEIIDTSATDFKNIVLSAIAKITTSLTPYFKAAPFSDSIRTFNFASPFGIKEKVVSNLDDSKLFSVQGQYDQKKTMNELRGMYKALEGIETQYYSGRQHNEHYSVREAAIDFQAKMNKRRNERIDDINNSKGSSFEERQIRNIFPDKNLNSLETLSDAKKVVTEAMYLESNKKDFSFELDEFGFDAESAPRAFKKFGLTFTENIETDANNVVSRKIEVGINNRMIHKNTILVKDNELYVKTGENADLSFKKIADDVVYSSNNFVKKVQSDIRGFTYTNDTGGTGIFTDPKEKPNVFDYQDLKNSDNKLKYLKDSDINFLPFGSKKPYNEEESLPEFYIDRVKKGKAVFSHLREKGEGINVVDRIRYYTGFDLNPKGSSTLEKDELAAIYAKAGEKLKQNYGRDEFEAMVKTVGKDVDFAKDFYIFNKQYGRPYAIKTPADLMMKAEGLIDEVIFAKKNLGKFKELDDELLEKAKMYEINKIAKLQTDGMLDQIYRKKMDPSMDEKVEDLYRAKFIENLYKNSGDLETFHKFVPEEVMKDNMFFNMERLSHMNRENPLTRAKATFIKKSFTDIDFKRDGFSGTVAKIAKEFKDTSSVNNQANMLLMEMVESTENTFNILGMPKLGPGSRTSGAKSLKDLLLKRVAPMYIGVGTALAINAAVDAALPDWVPLIGEGAVAGVAQVAAMARMATQIAINATGLGFIFRTLEDKYPGILTGNGLFAPLDLADTNQSMYEKLFEGKEVEVRKNRFWYTSGRQEFQGGEIKTFRPHLLYLLQHRDSEIYGNKVERFFRKDFLPTSLPWYFVDPYKEERILDSKGTFMPKSERLFEDIPIIGGALSATLGEFIKPTKYFQEDKWRFDKDHIINPDYNPANPSSQPLLKIKEANFFERSLIPAYNDLTSLFGMRGYYFRKGVETFVGDPNISEGLTLDSFDRHRGIAYGYESLELGGMFGTTEGIRRVISDNKLNQNAINPLQNESMPDWMPSNYYKPFHRGKGTQFGAYAETVLPGEQYERIHEMHSDEKYGKYGLLDRLRILAINAPHSDEFKMYRAEAMKGVMEGTVKGDDIRHAFQSLSYAESIIQPEVFDNPNQKAKLDEINIDGIQASGFGEFIDSEGKRYKLAGIDIKNIVMGNRGSGEVQKDIDTLTKFLNDNKQLTVYRNSNLLSAVKFDSHGEYIEVYSPETDKLKSLSVPHYLKNTYDPVSKVLNWFQNMYKPNFMEKAYNKKSTFERWYDESVITPEFKDWDSPYDSFVTPIFDKSRQGFTDYLQTTEIAMRASGGDVILPVMNTLAYLDGLVFGNKTPDRYRKEDLVQNTLEYQEHMYAIENGKNDNSVFSIRPTDSIGKFKSFLSPTEKKYFDAMVNVTDDEERDKIYKAASNRLRIVLNAAWQKKERYIGESLGLPEFEPPQLDVLNIGQDSYNESNYDNQIAYARIKMQMGDETNTYEKRNMAKQVSDEVLKSNPEYIKELVQKSRKSVKKQTVLSNTFGIDASFIKVKREE